VSGPSLTSAPARRLTSRARLVARAATRAPNAFPAAAPCPPPRAHAERERERGEAHRRAAMASRAECSGNGSNGVEGRYGGVENSGSLTVWFQMKWALDLEKFRELGLYTGALVQAVGLVNRL